MRLIFSLILWLPFACEGLAAGPNATPPATKATPAAAVTASAIPAAQPGADMAAWLTKTEAQFREPYEREALKPYEDGKNALKQRYLAIVTPMITAAADKARGEELAFLIKERQRLFDGAGVPPDDADKPLPALVAPRAAFRLEMAKLEQEFARTARLHFERCDKSFAEAQATLAQRQQPDEAALVKTKREEIAKSWLPAPVATAPVAAVKTTPAPGPAVATTAAAMYEVGEWLLKCGAEISTHDGKKNVRLTSASALAGGRVPITKVVLEAMKMPAPPAPEELGRLASLKSLRQLDIKGIKGDDTTMAFIAHLQELEDLSLAGSRCTDQFVETLVSHARLQELSLHNAKQFTGKSLDRLAEARDLRKVDLEGCAISDEGAAAIAKLSHLETLGLNSTKVTDAALPALGRLADLITLNLYKSAVTSKGLAALKGLRKLEHINYLDAAMPSLPEAVRETAAAFPKLVSWRLNGAAISAEAIQTLGQVRTLSRLALSGKLAPAALNGLTSLPALEKLVLVNADHTDTEMAPVFGLRLKSLEVSGKGITDDFLEKLKRMRTLKELRLTMTSVTPQAMAALEKQLPGCNVTK